MPTRGLLVVIALIVLGVAGYAFFGLNQPADHTPQSVSNDITEGEKTPLTATTALKPTFDIVRVDRSGEAVVAGRAAPGAEVTVLLNGREIGSAIAGDDGSWVVVIEEPIPVGTQQMSLSSRLADGTAIISEQVVVIDVPERRDSLPLIVLGAPDAASRVLQRPEALGEPGALSIETVDYDEQGNVIITGRAAPGSSLRIYLDNQPIGSAQAGEDGLWTLRPKDVEAGVYTMRVDQMGPDAQVVARIEVPFERADPGVVAKAMLRAGGSVVVQPGNSLWRIAREVYGEGYQYTVIYEANRDQIRDPDLIYPGQIFELPSETGE